MLGIPRASNAILNPTCIAVLSALVILVQSESAYTDQIEIQTELQTGGPPAHDKRQRERQLFERLQSHAAEDAGLKPVQVKITADEWASLSPETQDNGPLRVGVVKPVDVSIEPAMAGSSTGNDFFGARRRTDDGGFVWTGVLKVSHIGGLRVHLVGVDLPRGTSLYVYNDMGQAHGPYEGRGPLHTGEVFTHALRGSELRLQIEGKGDGSEVPAIGIESLGFTTDRLVTGLDQTAYVAGDSQILGQGSYCESSADCVENASCHSGTPADTARQAVALLMIQTGGGPFTHLCSGALVADTDPDSTIPYLITTSFCIADETEAASLEAYFDYATSCTNPNCELPLTPDVVGSTLLARDETSGYTLVRLSGNPQSADGIEAYLGWSTLPVAEMDGTDLFRISHPMANPQAYSEHTVDTFAGTCGIWPRGDFIYSRDTLGATEPGGFGAPAVNADGQMVGIHMGACGTNTGDVCDSFSNATVDAAFADFYPALAPWLCVPPSNPPIIDDGFETDPVAECTPAAD